MDKSRFGRKKKQKLHVWWNFSISVTKFQKATKEWPTAIPLRDDVTILYGRSPVATQTKTFNLVEKTDLLSVFLRFLRVKKLLICENLPCKLTVYLSISDKSTDIPSVWSVCDGYTSVVFLFVSPKGKKTKLTEFLLTKLCVDKHTLI